MSGKGRRQAPQVSEIASWRLWPPDMPLRAGASCTAKYGAIRGARSQHVEYDVFSAECACTPERRWLYTHSPRRQRRSRLPERISSRRVNRATGFFAPEYGCLALGSTLLFDMVGEWKGCAGGGLALVFAGPYPKRASDRLFREASALLVSVGFRPGRCLGSYGCLSHSGYACFGIL